ncbi:uncharacterized protein LOC121729948 [Aricia agestis]|uniref:uncharacterized protein LOC121729948 n=1 Tax=Aricia agestis TaxID=91739 RepID=UPI001C2041DC|nr:uncharacterized protein LOC121729948 [Aricia agestis]
MAFTEIIIAVAYFLQVSIAQVNNGQPFNQNLKLNNVGESDKGLQNIADNSNFRRNYINFAENRLSQSKLSQNRLSDFFNQKASPLENYQNTIFTNNPSQFLNTRQQNVETQDVSSALWGRQDANLGNNVNLTPSNELPLTSNILPAPNIANNYLMPTAPSTQVIIPPSLTISTSLPSFVPKALPTTNYIKLQPRNQLTHDTNSNKVFAAIAEPPKITTNAANYYYVPPNPPSVSSQKSLSMKTLLPLILNLLNDKNDECSCCSHCHRRNSRHNLGEIPLIDTGYSKQRTYGPPSDESYEDSVSEEQINDTEKKNDKSYRKRKYRRNDLSNEDKESQSDED